MLLPIGLWIGYNSFTIFMSLLRFSSVFSNYEQFTFLGHCSFSYCIYVSVQSLDLKDISES